MPRTGVRAEALLLLGVLFAGDSFWVAAAAIALGGGVLVLGLLGNFPVPRGGEYVLGRCWHWRRGADSPSPGRSRPTAPGTSSTEPSRMPASRCPRRISRGTPRAAGVPGGRRAARRRLRRGDCLGPGRQGDPGALRGWRPGGAATRSDRLLERARARGRRLARPLPLDRYEPLARSSAPTRRAALALRGHRGGAARRLARRCARGVRRRRAVARRSPTAGSSAAAALAVALPAFVVAAWAFTRDALVEDGQAHADRVADGRWFALACVLGAVTAVGGVARSSSATGPQRRRDAASDGCWPAVVAALVVGVAAVAAAGDPLATTTPSARTRAASATSGSTTAASSGARRGASSRPIRCSVGADTFEIARKRHRADALDAAEPHNVPLQFLATTGVVGLALFVCLVAASTIAVVAALRRLEGLSEQPRRRSPSCRRCSYCTRSSTTTGTSPP